MRYCIAAANDQAIHCGSGGLQPTPNGPHHEMVGIERNFARTLTFDLDRVEEVRIPQDLLHDAERRRHTQVLLARADAPGLGLHVGEVLFGNIGSPERLDFTVVGPAVNEVARIAAMCRSVERKLLVSTAFHDAAAPEDRAGLVSVGRYALRGVGAAQDLYTVVA